MSFLSYRMSSKRGIWKWEVFFTLGFIWSVPGWSIYHYYLLPGTSFLIELHGVQVVQGVGVQLS